jgi:hypothetical protein
MGGGPSKDDFSKDGAYKTMGDVFNANFEKDYKGVGEALGMTSSLGLSIITGQVLEEGRTQEEIDAVQQEYYVLANPFVTAEERALPNVMAKKNEFEVFWNQMKPGLEKMGNTFGHVINSAVGANIIPKIGDGLKFGELPPPPQPEREQTILEKLSVKELYQQAQEYVKQNPGTVGLGVGGVLVAVYAVRAARGP